jgi:hypothetical protein
MKTLIYFGLVLILFTSCNAPSFVTANNMRNIMGKVYFKNGTIEEGEISVNNDGGFARREFIRFKPRNGKEEKIAFQDFEELEIRGEYYVPRKLQEGNFFTNNNMFLVKRLTKLNSRIQFYEHLRIRNRSNTNANGQIYNDNYRTFDYFIQMNGMNKYETHNILGRNIVPNFEDKVSELVKDCTPLAAKIKAKEKGYFYAQVSFNQDKRFYTWMQIIDDYNNCK